MKNRILAIAAAPAATPVKPNKAATTATIAKNNAILSIRFLLTSVGEPDTA
ncbi:hypothetical protein [Paraburkholderia sp. SIMBA_027]|uniref:hypothetical protein n=1 Tax=Paraburkholderia sp. SIMBA_027 TaxID=3085770 RepID=UPI003979DEA9